MSNHKISVIIPVYNAEKTIGNILEKLISQSYKNIEVILVNDGSKDGSWEILQKFAKKDKRIIPINQKNAGASIARNTGIEKATGEFLTFIDSDDDISSKLIEELAAHINYGSSDFIMCGMSINGKEIIAPGVFIENKKSITQYVLKSLLTKNLLYGPCCKLFRRSIVSEHKVRFPELVKYGEDTIFVLEYLRYSLNLQVINESLYEYNFSSEGTASNNNAIGNFRKARTRALNIFMKGRWSFRSFILYAALRSRWAAALVKVKYLSEYV